MNKFKVRQWDRDVKAFPFATAGTALRRMALTGDLFVLRHMHRRETRILRMVDVVRNSRHIYEGDAVRVQYLWSIASAGTCAVDRPRLDADGREVEL